MPGWPPLRPPVPCVTHGKASAEVPGIHRLLAQLLLAAWTQSQRSSESLAGGLRVRGCRMVHAAGPGEWGRKNWIPVVQRSHTHMPLTHSLPDGGDVMMKETSRSRSCQAPEVVVCGAIPGTELYGRLRSCADNLSHADD
jgi:hypothetical protein